MILIADSGSTKCDWVLVIGKNIRFFSTSGFNPFFHSENDIIRTIKKNKNLIRFASGIEYVFLYGAGCSSKKRNKIVENALKKIFSKSIIHIDHDLMGAAYATYQGEPCISCILGTGSNACFFDGKTILQTNPALSYILGDEGSGSYYGKILLRKFIYNQLPPKIHSILQNKYGLNKEIIFENIYRKPFPNRYLASFMKILTENKKDKFVRETIAKGMEDFMQNHVCCFKNYRKVKIHFVGSIAFYHEDILRKVAAKLKIKTGKIIRRPVDNLVDYHLKYVLNNK